mmetsp:Transcript_10259/g.28271  ORF Transcript_10259/g.28271 Transcript_10259/m.28271 type:complete len:686 (-) Transcript_10259:1111-3168(-)
MGHEIKRIVSDEHHYSQYECIICQSLVDLDCLLTTACSHVFCRACLLPWLKRNEDSHEDSAKCPTCNQDLLYSTSAKGRHDQRHGSMMVGSRAVLVQPMQVCQPLAFRVLKRIQVSCPLRDASTCSWQGDYGDLQDHLLSSSAHTTTKSGNCIETQSRKKQPVGEEPATPMEVEEPQTSRNSFSQFKSVPDDSLHHNVAVATSYKEEANTKFATQQYQQARDLYSKAISVLDESQLTVSDVSATQLLATLYSNRAACQHGLNNFQAAAEDASAAVIFDPTYAKAYMRQARALVQMADFGGALKLLSMGLSKCPSNSSSLLQKEHGRVSSLQQQHDRCLALLDEKEFATAKAGLGNLLRDTTAPLVLLEAAEADLGMGLVDSARRLCLQASRRSNTQDPKSLLVQGQCNILSCGEKEDSQFLDSGVSLLKHVMRMDPDNQTVARVIKKWLKSVTLLSSARKASFERRFEEALQLFSTCIDTCPILPPKAPLHSALRTERALVLLRLKKYDNALQDVALVTYYREDYVTAWTTRFAALHGKGEHETALEETKELLQKWGQNEPRIRQAYEKADFLYRKAKRPDFYTMLGVSSIASEREIKKAYRVVARDMHPDRFATASEAERLKAKKDFQQLSEGLEILSDDFQRKLYDEGYDVEAIKERVQAAEQAAHRPQYGHGSHGSHGRYHY